MCYWMKPLTAPPGGKQYEIDEKVNSKVVEHHRFSTKRHLMVMNAKNRTLKMHICLFAASETVTSRNLNERRKAYLSDEKRDPNVAQFIITSIIYITGWKCGETLHLVQHCHEPDRDPVNILSRYSADG
ncbi:hypothetical protein AVEN_50440-1 [Araneus ventricosus]|uniref:Uncharacterized protein n=1 Tax=Araneus ventricosus TaxID=182803 RepID=A0A4Y2A0A7_ARAVE|nr:hypothetical protein AVEN_50440-1 [Araneus ventricosus]